MAWAQLTSNSTIYKGDTTPITFAIYSSTGVVSPFTSANGSATVTVISADNGILYFTDQMLAYENGQWVLPIESNSFDNAATALSAPGRFTTLTAQLQVTAIGYFGPTVQTLAPVQLNLVLNLADQLQTLSTYTVDGGAPQLEPTPWGTYNPDSPWKHFFCNPGDVMAKLAGVDTRRFEAKIAENMPVPPVPGLGTLGSWISYLISLEESAVESDLNQPYRPQQITQHLDGNGEVTMYLPFYPIISVEECILNAIISVQWYTFQYIRYVDSLGFASEQYIYDADLLIDSALGSLTIPPRILYLNTTAVPFWNYTFLKGDRNVSVVYTFGFKNPQCVPDAFRSAVACRVAMKVLYGIGMMAGEGASEVSIENVRTAYSRNHNLPYSDLFDRLDKECKKTLNKWKRITV